MRSLFRARVKGGDMNGKDRKTLNEKDCLTDILTGEKELLGLYALCLGETEGKELSKVLKTALEKNGGRSPHAVPRGGKERLF